MSEFWPSMAPRASMEQDAAVDVSGGPAGLTTAIRPKQLASKTGQEVSVVGAGSESGAGLDTKSRPSSQTKKPGVHR